MTNTPYGEIWRTQPPRFWNWMWQTRCGAVVTERILSLCLEADSIIEIGCGYGHFCKELLKRGWTGSSYLGFDLSDGPATFSEIVPAVVARKADFMGVLAEDSSAIGNVDLIISQAVLCHQAHWLPMTLAAMKHASAIALDVSYVTDEPLHNPRRRDDGCYDTYISEKLLLTEIAALGLPIKVERLYNNKRGCAELLLTTHKRYALRELPK